MSAPSNKFQNNHNLLSQYKTNRGYDTVKSQDKHLEQGAIASARTHSDTGSVRQEFIFPPVAPSTFPGLAVADSRIEVESRIKTPGRIGGQWSIENSEEWNPEPLQCSPATQPEIGVPSAGARATVPVGSSGFNSNTATATKGPFPRTPGVKVTNHFNPGTPLHLGESTKEFSTRSTPVPTWNAINKSFDTAVPTIETSKVGTMATTRMSRTPEYRTLYRRIRDNKMPDQVDIDAYIDAYGPVPSNLTDRMAKIEEAERKKRKRPRMAKGSTSKAARSSETDSPARKRREITPLELSDWSDNEEQEPISEPETASAPVPGSTRTHAAIEDPSFKGLSKVPRTGNNGDKSAPLLTGHVAEEPTVEVGDRGKAKGELIREGQVGGFQPSMNHTAVTTQAFKTGARTVGIANKLLEDMTRATTVLKHVRAIAGSRIADEVIREFEKSNYAQKLEKPRFFFLGRSNDTHPHFTAGGIPSPSRFIPTFTTPFTDKDREMLQVHQQNVLKDSCLFQMTTTGGQNPETWYSTQETWQPKAKILAVTEEEFELLVKTRKDRSIDLTKKPEPGTVNPGSDSISSATIVPRRIASSDPAMDVTTAPVDRWPKWTEESWEHQRQMIIKAKENAREWNNAQSVQIEKANELLPAEQRITHQHVRWERFLRDTSKPRDPVDTTEFLEAESNVWDEELHNDSSMDQPGPPIPIQHSAPTPTPPPPAETVRPVQPAQPMQPVQPIQAPNSAYVQPAPTHVNQWGPNGQQFHAGAFNVSDTRYDRFNQGYSMSPMQAQSLPQSQAFGNPMQAPGHYSASPVPHHQQGYNSYHNNMGFGDGNMGFGNNGGFGGDRMQFQQPQAHLQQQAQFQQNPQLLQGSTGRQDQFVTMAQIQFPEHNHGEDQSPSSSEHHSLWSDNQ